MAKMTQTQIVAEMSTKTGVNKKQVKDFMMALTDPRHRTRSFLRSSPAGPEST